MTARGSKVLWSFITQRHQRIHAYRAPRRNVAGEQSHSDQQKRDSQRTSQDRSAARHKAHQPSGATRSTHQAARLQRQQSPAPIPDAAPCAECRGFAPPARGESRSRACARSRCTKLRRKFPGPPAAKPSARTTPQFPSKIAAARETRQTTSFNVCAPKTGSSGLTDCTCARNCAGIAAVSSRPRKKMAQSLAVLWYKLRYICGTLGSASDSVRASAITPTIVFQAKVERSPGTRNLMSLAHRIFFRPIRLRERVVDHHNAEARFRRLPDPNNRPRSKVMPNK